MILPTAFLTTGRLGVVGEDLPHRPSGDGEEVTSILHVIEPWIELQPRFVDQGGGLQRGQAAMSTVHGTSKLT